MFRIWSTDDGRQLPFEYKSCSAMTPKYGMAMTIDGGDLVLAAGETAPIYICCREETAAVEQGTLIPVVKIQADQVWMTEGSGEETVGAAYDIAEDGMSLADTSTGAAPFVVDSVDGTVVYGRLIGTAAAASDDSGDDDSGSDDSAAGSGT